MNSRKRFHAMMAGTVSVLVIFAIYALTTGQYSIQPGDILRLLAGKDVPANVFTVIVKIRLPRIIMAVCAGAGLAVAGASFQALFSNPLATPDTLGTANGASFGAALGILLGLSSAGIQMLALVCGIGAVALVFVISAGSEKHRPSLLSMILAGLVISSLFSALVSLIKYIADPNDVLPVITFWLMGSFSSTTYRSLVSGMPMIVFGTAVIVAMRHRLNVLTLSREEAISLGIPLKTTRVIVIVCASLITASVVSMCGVIGWVGLLIPHLSRLLVGNDNSRVIPLSCSLGGLFMLCVDTLARTLSVAEIPVSILTAVIGAPVFIFLLYRKGGMRA
ncbi:MAG: FecCD family ABC transporter permease [Bulleidia sp.]